MMPGMTAYAIPSAQEAHIRALLLDSAIPGPVQAEVMLGIPSAGKSLFVAQAITSGLFPKGAFILDPDRVMEALPLYHEDYRAIGPAPAFERWQLPCRNLAYAMGREAMQRRLPIIKDMGMARAENWDLVKEFKAAGYPVTLHAIHCPLEVAEADSLTRARRISPGMIRERAGEIERLLKENAHIPDRIFWYERADGAFKQASPSF